VATLAPKLACVEQSTGHDLLPLERRVRARPVQAAEQFGQLPWLGHQLDEGVGYGALVVPALTRLTTETSKIDKASPRKRLAPGSWLRCSVWSEQLSNSVCGRSAAVGPIQAVAFAFARKATSQEEPHACDLDEPTGVLYALTDGYLTAQGP